MASTSVAEPSSAIVEPPNWLEMPPDLMGSILQRTGAVEILKRARKVCTTWRRICNDPGMWKVIDIRNSLDYWNSSDGSYNIVDWDTYRSYDSGDFSAYDRRSYDLVRLTEQAVDLSCGELIDISIDGFGTDDLLDHIVLGSSKMNRLSLLNCRDITGSGLSRAVKRVPNLETLHLYYLTINVEDIELIGQNCPQLKSFTMNKEYRRPHLENDGDALAIANSMPELRHLQMFGSKMTNNGLEVILNNCPHLESLDVRRCFNLDLGGNFGKLCMERVKDFKGPDDSTEDCEFFNRVHPYDLEDMYESWYSDLEVSEDDEASGSEVSEDDEVSGSEEDDYDYYD